MNLQSTKIEKFEYLPEVLSRLSPYVITEIESAENKELFKNLLPRLEPYTLLENIESPKMLYEFLRNHKNELIIITDDIFAKRKNYRDIVQGALCSSPDSSALWPVYYLNEPSFTFKGKIILCTYKTKKQIQAEKKYKGLVRDCVII